MGRIDIQSLSLSQIPTEEDETFEFKSGQMKPNEFKQELEHAASGFSNSGGGCIVWGLDDKSGLADGGVEPTIGRQQMREWVDQVIHRVTPTPRYECRLFRDAEGKGTINPNNAIVVVSFDEGILPPYMAPDNRYYIRAGKHTVSAQHFIVDALWAKRHATKPIISHVIRPNPNAPTHLQLGLITVTDAPAVNVVLTIQPLKGELKRLDAELPLQIPVIDRLNPFFFEFGYRTWRSPVELEDVHIVVKYEDLSGNKFEYKNNVPLGTGLTSLMLVDDPADKIVNAIEKLAK
jgi:hypothetical protein